MNGDYGHDHSTLRRAIAIALTTALLALNMYTMYAYSTQLNSIY